MSKELKKLWASMGETRFRIASLKAELALERRVLDEQNKSFHMLLDRELGFDPEDDSVETNSKRFRYIKMLSEGA